MTNDDHKQGQTRGSEDHLDAVLDAALAKYAAVEPRAGLEDRVLANIRGTIRAEQARPTGRFWWRWGLAAATTVVVIVALILALRSMRPTQPLVRNPPSISTPVTREAAAAYERKPQLATPPRNATAAVRRAARHRAQPEAATANPKLDQFPSPQPLSAQEILLARYIAQDPERATLVAEARMEVLRQDRKEEEELSEEQKDSQSRDAKSR